MHRHLHLYNAPCISWDKQTGPSGRGFRSISVQNDKTRSHNSYIPHFKKHRADTVTTRRLQWDSHNHIITVTVDWILCYSACNLPREFTTALPWLPTNLPPNPRYHQQHLLFSSQNHSPWLLSWYHCANKPRFQKQGTDTKYRTPGTSELCAPKSS